MGGGGETHPQSGVGFCPAGMGNHRFQLGEWVGEGAGRIVPEGADGGSKEGGSRGDPWRGQIWGAWEWSPRAAGRGTVDEAEGRVL